MTPRPKYGAKRTVCGAGHMHDSGMEAKRCDTLTAMDAAGEITHLEQQPVYRVEIDGKLICKYVGDFRYRMTSGLQITEDVKGVLTPVFRLKQKLVEAAHSGTVITVWPPKVKKKRKASAARLAKQLRDSLALDD